MEEFTRAACDLLERDDLVASVANTRHAAECCAGVWYLLEQIERPIKDVSDPTDLHDQMMRLSVGTKIEEENMPKAINVLTFLQKLDRKIPGFFGSYERLSEIAHPNWAGSAAIFSKRDPETLITHFGRGLRETGYVRSLNLGCMMGSLEIFSYAYNRITDLMPDFCQACEQGIISREGKAHRLEHDVTHSPLIRRPPTTRSGEKNRRAPPGIAHKKSPGAAMRDRGPCRFSRPKRRGRFFHLSISMIDLASWLGSLWRL